jgi:hypothetical protein
MMQARGSGIIESKAGASSEKKHNYKGIKTCKRKATEEKGKQLNAQRNNY